MMKTLLALLVAFVLFPSGAAAQPATSTSKFEFSQDAASLAEAQGLVYRLYADANPTPTIMVVTCTGTVSPFLCTSPVGAFTPGAHTVSVTAGNAAGESPKSASITFSMVLIPNAPTGLKVKP